MEFRFAHMYNIDMCALNGTLPCMDPYPYYPVADPGSGAGGNPPSLDPCTLGYVKAQSHIQTGES